MLLNGAAFFKLLVGVLKFHQFHKGKGEPVIFRDENRVYCP